MASIDVTGKNIVILTARNEVTRTPNDSLIMEFLTVKMTKFGQGHVTSCCLDLLGWKVK